MKKKNKQKNIDLSPRNTKQTGKSAHASTSVLFFKGKKSEAFFTEDSKLYITPKEYEKLRQGIKLDRSTKKWDSLSSRIARDFKSYNPSQASRLTEALEHRYQLLQETAERASQNILGQFSLVRLWNISMVGAILFGMVTMTFVYRYLGQGAQAQEIKDVAAGQQVVDGSNSPRVLGAETSKSTPIETAAEIKTDEKSQLQTEIENMTKGYPIEKMAPYIANYNPTVAAFLVAIARQESSWGEHVPLLNGQDCYNYWGYRGQRELMGTGGHTCFDSPEDAVDTVAKRIDYLVSNENRNTGSKMVTVWKCGGDCSATGGQAAADNWADNVDLYLKKFNEE